MTATASLATRLGFGPEERLLIIAASGIGTTHAATIGGFDVLRRGLATTGRIHVPAPWARDAAARYRGEDIGVSFTLIAEHERFRWGPLTSAPSLLDGAGSFPTTTDDLWEHADPDEVRREITSQLERAIEWGIDVTHLDAHLDALHLRPELFDIELDLAIEFGLPLRLPDRSVERLAGFPFRSLAEAEGVVFPDHVVEIGRRPVEELEAALLTLAPGVTELRVTAALDTPEQRATTPDWARWVEHHQALVGDPSLEAWITRTGAKRIDYRMLRDAQRNRSNLSNSYRPTVQR
jgi:chitin disaccharide deacetylase